MSDYVRYTLPAFMSCYVNGNFITEGFSASLTGLGRIFSRGDWLLRSGFGLELITYEPVHRACQSFHDKGPCSLIASHKVDVL